MGITQNEASEDDARNSATLHPSSDLNEQVLYSEALVNGATSPNTFHSSSVSDNAESDFTTIASADIDEQITDSETLVEDVASSNTPHSISDYDEGESDATSISSAIISFVYENGRRYNAEESGFDACWQPNDELEQCRMDLGYTTPSVTGELKANITVTTYGPWF